MIWHYTVLVHSTWVSLLKKKRHFTDHSFISFQRTKYEIKSDEHCCQNILKSTVKVENVQRATFINFVTIFSMYFWQSKSFHKSIMAWYCTSAGNYGWLFEWISNMLLLASILIVFAVSENKWQPSGNMDCVLKVQA
jgi:hypothetical protein